MTRRQITALRRHADRLDRSAEQAKRHYAALRGTFPEYTMGSDRGMLLEAARAADDAQRAARNFRDRLNAGLRDWSDKPIAAGVAA